MTLSSVQPTQPTQPTRQLAQSLQPVQGMLTPQDHVASLAAALASFDEQVRVAERWGRHLASILPDGARLLAAGNGGSAAEAQHLTAEIIGRFRLDRRPFSAIALHADTSTYTAACNDYGADEAFARSVEAHGRPGDVLVLLSTSGRSPNLLAAARRARACGLTTWAMCGPVPNPLASLCDEHLAVPSGYPATVQELHLVGVHLVCASFDTALGVGRREVPLRRTVSAGTGAMP